jgi:single-stranded-DNA-specific exonuclease
MLWKHAPLPAAEVEDFSRRAGVSRVLAELLLRGGVAAPAAPDFLQPALARLQDPFLLPNVETGSARLARAIAEREEVVVLGDYDVDGVSSTALLVTVLRRFGLNPRYVVPRRSEDGYGLSRSAIDRALEGGRPGLFIALDCGTNSHQEAAYLRSLGVDVLVIDHHRSTERTLEDGLLINPHVHGGAAMADTSVLHLCTVGLVFKLCHGLLKRLRGENHPVAFRVRLRDQLDLVALGTIADLVPLQGENRILARNGLRILEATERPGLRALMDVAGVRPGNGLTPTDISFRLGPRINASGRLADASLSVDLLLSDDAGFCVATARQLDAFNRERQEIERAITDEAERRIEGDFSADSGVVLFSESWHPGVVGVVAGRVTRKYNRPCVVLGKEGELAKGSGRSVEGINLVEVLASCADDLESWGGHPMAVGVALSRGKVEGFRRRFADAVRAHSGGGPGEASIEIAAWLTPEQVTDRLVGQSGTGFRRAGRFTAAPGRGVQGATLSFPVRGRPGTAASRRRLEARGTSAPGGTTDRPGGGVEVEPLQRAAAPAIGAGRLAPRPPRHLRNAQPSRCNTQ